MILETSSDDAPGYSTNISIIGTEICGSSCLGVASRPIIPAPSIAMNIIIERGDVINALVNLPASPSSNSTKAASIFF
jgi:hypothetical protein